MATINVGKTGLFNRGEKTLQSALNKAIDKDVIQINNSKLVIDDTLRLKPNVEITGNPDKPAPTLIVKGRGITGLYADSKYTGDFKLSHLNLVLTDQVNGLVFKNQNSKLELDHVNIYHANQVSTFYNSFVMDTKATSNLVMNHCVIDQVELAINQVNISQSNLGDYYLGNSKLYFKQGEISNSALQNLMVTGYDPKVPAMLQLNNDILGGNVSFYATKVIGQNLKLVALPTINHQSYNLDTSDDNLATFEKERTSTTSQTKLRKLIPSATSLLVGKDADVELTKVEVQQNVDELMEQTKLTIPKFRAFGTVGGSLAITNSDLEVSELKNVARAGTIKFENVHDHSDWELSDQVKAVNRNSQSPLFDAQSQLDLKTATTGNHRSTKSALDQLDELIGLKDVKTQVKQLIAKSKMNAERKRRGQKYDEKQSSHMVFAGSPGTGKTVVARLVAQALYENGVLKSPNFKEARQAQLVGETVGSTAPKTKAVVKEALDGVLFIDEAYQLAPPKGGGNSFNDEAVTELIADMENYSDRLIVIMAGYTKDMSDFFANGNSGLASRMNNWIEFPDYSVDELKEIERLDVKKQGIRFNKPEDIYELDNGIDRLLPIINRSKAPGNGRFVRSYIQKVCEMRDERLAQGNIAELSDDQLNIVEPLDVRKAVNVMSQQAVNMNQ